MKNYFLPRHLGIETPKKKGRTRIKSRSNRPSAVERQKLYREALAKRMEMVSAEQQGVPVGEGNPMRIHCEFCFKRGKLHGWDDPHHTAGRRGTNMYDPNKLRLICRRIHNKVHRDPQWGKEVGLLE